MGPNSLLVICTGNTPPTLLLAFHSLICVFWRIDKIHLNEVKLMVSYFYVLFKKSLPRSRSWKYFLIFLRRLFVLIFTLRLVVFRSWILCMVWGRDQSLRLLYWLPTAISLNGCFSPLLCGDCCHTSCDLLLGTLFCYSGYLSIFASIFTFI